MNQTKIPTPSVDPQISFFHERDREPNPYDPQSPEPKDDYGPPNMDPHGDGEGGKDYY